MKNPLSVVRRKVANGTRELTLKAARTGLPQSGLNWLRQVGLAKRVVPKLESSSLALTLRQAETMPLSDGHYYVRLRFPRWHKRLGQYIKLYCNGEQIYGNVIEEPEAGTPIEYRNIVGSSANPADYSINLPDAFSVEISQYPFVTKQQARFDARFNVQQHGRVFYSIRGNLANPQRVLFTFPGFTLSTSSISYTVSYLKDLTPVELKNAAVVVFQDRYYVPGSYMLVDSEGAPVVDDVADAMQSILSSFGLTDSDAMLFGASKGASIALFYGQFLPKARLVLSTPQLNLPYYFTKPAFRENLYNLEALRSFTQPSELLLQYLTEGRHIDFFYTNRDELSNQSMVEFPIDARNFVSHRISGVHTDVARRGLPTMLGVMRGFLTGAQSAYLRPLVIDSVKIRLTDNGLISCDLSLLHRVQIDSEHNWYLQRRHGDGILRYEIEEVESGRRFTLNDMQLLNPQIDDLSGEWSLMYITENNSSDSVNIECWSEELRRSGAPTGENAISPGDIDVRVASSGIYTIVDGDVVTPLRYAFMPGDRQADQIAVVISMNDNLSLESIGQPVSGVLILQPDQNINDALSQFIMRVSSRVYAQRILFFFDQNLKDSTYIPWALGFDWKSIVVDSLS
ncbi:hypothetical protein ACTOVL_03510 [Arcanobacterium canis]